MYALSQEIPEDETEVEYLFDTAFAPGRAALSSYRLRDGVEPVAELCLTARDDMGVLAGAIRFWPVEVAGQACLLLGPVAVHPTRQGEGLGAALMEDALDKAAALGWERVILVGDEPYYKRYGFSVADGLEFPPPTNPQRLLWRALKQGAFEGVSGPVSKLKG